MKQLISVGELIDQSWSKYRSAFPFFMQISGWLVIVALVNTIALLLYPSAGAINTHVSLTSGEVAGVILYGISNVLIAPLLGFWIFVSLVIGTKAVVSHTHISLMQVAQETKKLYFPALAVTALIALTLLLAQIITLGPAIVFGFLGFWLQNAWVLGFSNVLLLIGLVASLILTARWTIYYLMAPFASVLNHDKNKQALLNSRKLTEGKFWSVLIRFLLPKIVFILFGIVVAFLISILLNAVVIGSTGLNVDVQQRINGLATTILPVLVMIFLNPLIFLSDVLLYQSLKEQSV